MKKMISLDSVDMKIKGQLKKEKIVDQLKNAKTITYKINYIQMALIYRQIKQQIYEKQESKFSFEKIKICIYDKLDETKIEDLAKALKMYHRKVKEFEVYFGHS